MKSFIHPQYKFFRVRSTQGSFFTVRICLSVFPSYWKGISKTEDFFLKF